MLRGLQWESEECSVDCESAHFAASDDSTRRQQLLRSRQTGQKLATVVGSFKDKEFYPQRADLDSWGGIRITISERDVLKFVRAMVHTAEAACMTVKVSSIERDWASGKRPRISPVAAGEHDPKGTPRRPEILL